MSFMNNQELRISYRAPLSSGRIPFSREYLKKTVVDRFEFIVKTHPQSVAINDMGDEYTYQELNLHATTLAREIYRKQKRFGNQENAIGLILGQKVDTIIGILGTLKAGGFFTPIDPGLPNRRITYLLNDSNVKLLITNNKYLPIISRFGFDEKHVINLDTLEQGNLEENLEIHGDENSITNLVYTSGSTGNPKGVIFTNRNLLHSAWWGGEIYAISPKDRVSLISSFSFGGAILHSFRALLNGGSLYLYDIKNNGLKKLGKWLIDNNLTVFQATPTTFRQFVKLIEEEDSFPALRIVNMGGETIRRSDIELFYKYFSENTLLRLGGGTTEALIIATCFLKHGSVLPPLGVPMGYIIPDKEVEIWDEHNRLVYGEEIGEIVVRSKFLSAGYWNQSDRKQQGFFADPDCKKSGLYKTGDLGILTTEGLLFHKGRKDFQIKIRGQRVELGEIETTLLALEGVLEAAVIGRPDPEGETRLIAYLVPEKEINFSISLIRSYLTERLPDYMVPRYYYFLEEFPLTTSMKTDYSSLPDPGTDRPNIDTPYMPPRSSLEEKLASIWSEVLNVVPIGINDSFFDLGGHSLQVTQIINKVQAEFMMPIKISQLFEAPTVLELAALIKSNMKNDVKL